MEDHQLVHIAKRHATGSKSMSYLFLRKNGEVFQWFEDDGKQDIPLDLKAPSIQDAMRLGFSHWKEEGFIPLACGFLYTLPERDECGIPAFFYQLVQAENSFNGVFVDENLGHPCFIQGISKEARALYKKLKEEKRL